MTEVGAEFYSWGSLATLSVAAGAVVLISGAFRKLTGLSHPAVPFLIALLLVVSGAVNAEQPLFQFSKTAFLAWVLTACNTFLLFATAMGGQEVVLSPRVQGGGTGIDQYAGDYGWFSSWLR